MRSQNNWSLLTLLMVTIPLFLLLGGGCGGGTRGSGGQLFEGVVFDANQRALPGVSVSILSTGDSAVTDTSGAFAISTSDVRGGVDFLLEAENFSGRVSTQEIPDDAARIFVTFTVGTGNSPTITSEVEVKDRQPKPTAVPRATATPRPTFAPGTPVPSTTPVMGGSGSTGADGDDDKEGEDEDDDSHNGGSDDSGSGPDDSGDDDDNDDDDEDQSGGSGSTGGTGASGGSGDDGESDEKEIDIRGEITSIAGNLVTVSATTFVASAATEYRVKKGEAPALTSFMVGDSVEAKGKVRDGIVSLERLEKK